MALSAYVNLNQRKLVTGVGHAQRFWVQERAGSASELLAAPFKVLVGGTADSASLAEFVDVDPAGSPLAVNPLNRLSRGTTFVGTALPGDLLELSNLPEWWGYPDGQVLSSYVVSVDAEGLVLDKPFWTKETSLTWALSRAAVPVASGTDGSTLRQNTATGYFLDTQFQTSFLNATEALTHIAYTQKMLRSLADEIKNSGQQYLDAPPGNPITTNIAV